MAEIQIPSFPGPAALEMQTFSSLSGAEMVCTIGGRVFGELQGLAYSVEREIAPVFTTGSATLRAYSRGKRGITGTLVYQVFNVDSLLDALVTLMESQGIDLHTAVANMIAQEDFAETPGMSQWVEIMERDLGDLDQATPEQLFKRLARKHIRYLDQIPPFDITVTGRSELGLDTSMRILKVQLMTEASGFSVDDLTLEKACSFIARDVIPWGHDKLGQSRGISLTDYN